MIGVRSFGADPELVARHVAAFVRGTQRQGVAACAKHFPGHGDTAVDSHVDLPVVGGDVATALLPFRAAIAEGVQAVMTAHLLVPELDELPATLSRRIVTGLLREELGFEGLVVTDALEMRAISGGVGVEEAAVLALAAGVDALCVGHDLHEETVDALVGAISEAVRSGRLPLERLEEAAARVATTVALDLSRRCDLGPGPRGRCGRRSPRAARARIPFTRARPDRRGARPRGEHRRRRARARPRRSLAGRSRRPARRKHPRPGRGARFCRRPARS